MAGKGILERLNKIRNGDQERPGVLPMRAFYGREPEAELERGRMYRQVAEVMRMKDDDSVPGDAGQVDLRYLTEGRRLLVINANSSPVEHLVSRGEMETRLDEEGMGGARFHTALRIRDLLDGAQVKTIRSPSLEGTGGGGTVSAGDIRGYQLDCMKLVEKLKKGMPRPWLFPMIEGVVWRDDWLDIGEKVSARRKTILALHYALDCAGVVLGYAPKADLTQRWPDGPPAMPPAIRRRIQASTAAGRLALQT